MLRSGWGLRLPALAIALVGLSVATAGAAAVAETLLVANFSARHVTFLDTVRGPIAQVEVGATPWDIAIGPDGRAYVSTTAGVAVVDIARRERVATVAYRAQIGAPQTGEYRPGGMGIAVAPGGRSVYVGVHLPDGSGRLEIVDVGRRAVTASVAVGIRPFDVLVSRDGRAVYTVDHDSFSVTVVDVGTLRTRTLEVAPLGRGAFDKPHYAAQGPNGDLWLPVQGRALVRLSPHDGRATTATLTADTHQHDVAFGPDGRRLFIVGTGAAGQTTRGPSVTVYDTVTGAEEIVPMARPHERVAVGRDGRRAFLTGGYLLGPWDGVTILDLRERRSTEFAVPGGPLGVAVAPTLRP